MYAKSSKGQSTLSNTIFVIAVWYAASIVSVCSSKIILNELPTPGFLAVVQSVISVFSGWSVGKYMNAPQVFRYQLPWLGAAAATYCGNLLCTNVSFMYGSAPLTETIKSMEPVIVSLLAIPMLGENLTFTGLLAILFISIGTAIACAGDTIVITTAGVVFALLAISSNGINQIILKILNGLPIPIALRADVEKFVTSPPLNATDPEGQVKKCVINTLAYHFSSFLYFQRIGARRGPV